MEEYPRDEQSYPDDKTKQTHDIDRCQFSYALFPEFFEIGDNPDCKECQDKEHNPEDIASTD